MLQSPWNWSITSDSQLGPSHVTRDHVLFQESADYRVVRDLNFSDHVKRKKALKLYIILILKTLALRIFL